MLDLARLSTGSAMGFPANVFCLIPINIRTAKIAGDPTMASDGYMAPDMIR